jgi:hypothetical protein
MNAQKYRLSAWAAPLLLTACATTPNANRAASLGGQAGSQDPSCLHDTGSRIADPNQRCRGFGRSYSSQQIEETGATTVGEALRLLDPSVQVRP